MSESRKIALVTGASRRIGAVIADTLHQAGYDVVVHYGQSNQEADQLVARLNVRRENSACCVQADLQSVEQIRTMVDEVVAFKGRLDVVVNNASSFYPTSMSDATEEHWSELFGSNVKAPFFISQAAFPALNKTEGCIVNIVDIHANKGLVNYPIYSTAKAGLKALTCSLAKELAPNVRVNGVSPGVILWPEHEANKADEAMLDTVPLKRQGCPEDIAEMVLFLSEKARYVTGQVIAVDGGKSLL